MEETGKFNKVAQSNGLFWQFCCWWIIWGPGNIWPKSLPVCFAFSKSWLQTCELCNSSLANSKSPFQWLWATQLWCPVVQCWHLSPSFLENVEWYFPSSNKTADNRNPTRTKQICYRKTTLANNFKLLNLQSKAKIMRAPRLNYWQACDTSIHISHENCCWFAAIYNEMKYLK